MPTIRQTLFFSATMPPEIQKLADAFLMNPKEITVSRPATTAITVKQGLAVVPGEDKREALRRLIRNEDVKNALIFCNRKKDVDILFQSLRKHGFSVGALHGDMSQSVRTETLERFKLGEIRLLVASDVAARGLDIDDLSHVFNFDAPFHADDYVHRIGRTGRAGKTGVAYTLATPDDGGLVEAIEKLIGKPIPRVEVPGFDALEFDPEGGDGRRRGRGRGRGRPEPRGRSRGRDERRPRRDQDRDGIDDLQPPADDSVMPVAAEAEPRPPGDRPERRDRRRGRERERDRSRDGVTETGGYEGPTQARAGREEHPQDEAPRERRREPRRERPPRREGACRNDAARRGSPRGPPRGSPRTPPRAWPRSRRGSLGGRLRRCGAGLPGKAGGAAPPARVDGLDGSGQRSDRRRRRGRLMQTVFILVKCELGKAYEVADNAVQSIEQVSEVHSISGSYDLLMKCYLDDATDIGHFVTSRVQTLPGIKDTYTYITFKAFS